MRNLILLVTLLISLVATAFAAPETRYIRACGTNGDGTLSSCTGGGAGTPGAYSNIDNAINDLNSDYASYVSSDVQVNLDCSGTFTVGQVDSTSTMSATQYLRVFAQAGNTCDISFGFGDYGFRITGTDSKLIFENLFWKGTVANGSGRGALISLNTTGNQGDVTVLNSTLYYDTAGTDNTNTRNAAIDGDSYGGTLKVINSVLYDFYNCINTRTIFKTAGTQVYYNNTISGCRNNGVLLDGQGSNDNLYFINNVIDTTTAASYSAGTFSTDVHSNNVAWDANGPDAGGNSKTCTYTNAGAKDFTLTGADVNCTNQGTSLAADGQYAFAADKIGTVRPQGAAWDVGAFETAGAPAATNGFMILMKVGK